MAKHRLIIFDMKNELRMEPVAVIEAVVESGAKLQLLPVHRQHPQARERG